MEGLSDRLDVSVSEQELKPTEEVTSNVEDKEISAEHEKEDDITRVQKVTLENSDNSRIDKDDDDKDAAASGNLPMDKRGTDDVDERHDGEFLPSSGVDLQIAGLDVQITELKLEKPLAKFDIILLLQKCLKSTVPSCVYCNHARRISVNGKQLGLHAISEHRFSAIVDSITAEELILESFVARIKEGLPELENMFFNLEPRDSNEKVGTCRHFECFQCRFSAETLKGLHLHNRTHTKSVLLCSMCKSNFSSYSELICHLCPGQYAPDYNVQFQCCVCISDKLPSAFRLMVHLRQKHSACDICLQLCVNQLLLSVHIRKHRLHHICYQCGVTYCQKSDMKRHLFWKHGTESKLCKRCLKKKWPYVYHFCIPPETFWCPVCTLTFTRATSLVVHTRLHINEKPHACRKENCTEAFISKKLLLKHEIKHEHYAKDIAEVEAGDRKFQQERDLIDKVQDAKPKVDIFHLPKLNLSETDSSDPKDETQKSVAVESGANVIVSKNIENIESDLDRPMPAAETIWDEFLKYQAHKEKYGFADATVKDKKMPPFKDVSLRDSADATLIEEEIPLFQDVLLHNSADATVNEDEIPPLQDVPLHDSADATVNKDEILPCQDVLHDHDYSKIRNQDINESSSSNEDVEISVGHDSCLLEPVTDAQVQLTSSSSSSSDCSCKNCACDSDCLSSWTSLSTPFSPYDSSESESSATAYRRRQRQRRKRRKRISKRKKARLEAAEFGVAGFDNGSLTLQSISESDLETSESDSGEDFYIREPQKVSTVKRNEFLQMAPTGPLVNSTIPLNIPLKRRRTPNKFYVSSSDYTDATPKLKCRKIELSIPKSPLGNQAGSDPAPIVDPTSTSFAHAPCGCANEFDTNSSDEKELYCYCRRPYDELSQMIGCDKDDCVFKWFHFECVDIEVAPQGSWFCPDCRM